MIDIIRSLFSYDFAARALLAGTAISICAALLGVVMTLRRYTMLGDGLSHTAFGAVGCGRRFGLVAVLVRFNYHNCRNIFDSSDEFRFSER